MGELVNSICFQENNITWVQAETDGNNNVNIKRVAENPLPFVINYDNLQRSATSLEIANQLKKMRDEYGVGDGSVRFLIPARFGMVKKVYVDQYIPQDVHEEVVKFELEQTLPASTNDYLIYRPDYSRESNFLQELLTVVVPKNLFAFFREISEEAQLSVKEINLNCFALDNLYRKLFPNLIGETMLVNFTQHGYEFILSDQKNFLNYIYKPYSRNLQSVEQLSDEEIASNFISLVEDIQRPGSVDTPLYSISQIYVFGNLLKPEWLDHINDRGLPTTRILNPTDSTEWQIVFTEPSLNTNELYRFVEPFSNIF